MAVTFWELPKSRASQENPKQITYVYVLRGTQDRATARATALAGTPQLIAADGILLYRSDIKLDPQGFNLWNCTIPYVPYNARNRQPQANEFRWSFDTTGGTANITQALEHIQSYAPPTETAPDHKGAINVTDNGPEGTEIVIPQFRWTETWQLPAAFATFAYSDIVEAITGTVNDAVFRGKPAGSVRFDGAAGSGSSKDPNLVEITFNFVRGVAISNQTYGTITGVDKDAWEYIWFEYADQEDATAKARVNPPIAAHVERVYDSSDFSLLGIGTT